MFFTVETVEKKTFKVLDIATKCEMTKPMNLKGCDFNIIF
jgi:hypothetical protein